MIINKSDIFNPNRPKGILLRIIYIYFEMFLYETTSKLEVYGKKRYLIVQNDNEKTYTFQGKSVK